MSVPMVRVVRSSGVVQEDWYVIHRGDTHVRVQHSASNAFKSPTVELFDAWQEGSMATRTEELRQ